MHFVWENGNLNWIISLIVILAIYAGLFYIYANIVKRKAGYAAITISFGLVLICFLFDIMAAYILICSMTAVAVILSLFTNLGDLRKFLANPFKISQGKASKAGVEKIYNREDLYKSVQKAVLECSRTRTGAIITFEKSTSLEDIVKNGVAINAPVSSELLLTIFYPGTRLHDGAVVIRDNVIISASVFYTPTTKPFAGKYGSRHRAALGISEITDSITIVVSEETGRISFAVDGQLETVTPENFYRVFENYMDGIKEE